MFHLGKGIACLQEQVRNFVTKKINTRENTPKTGIVRFEIPIAPIDSLRWLSQQKNEVKIYWSERDTSFSAAGVGAVDVVTGNCPVDFGILFDRLRWYLSSDESAVKYYGGIQFNLKSKPDKEWSDFGTYYFIVPQFEVITYGGKYFCAYNILLHKNSGKYDTYGFDSISAEIPQSPASLRENMPDIVSRIDIPDKINWHRSVEYALDLIKTQELEKIVLARKAAITFSDKIHPVELTANLTDSNPNVFHFCIQPKEGCAFIGASPELLYKRENSLVNTEAVAGTRSGGITPDEDAKREKELLSNEKEKREHYIVHKNIEKILQSLCDNYEVSKDLSVMKLSHIMHLYSSFTGTLTSGITDAAILAALHPTPAVGGFPKKQALEYITRLEPFKRGWYAGPVGWVGSSNAEFAVGIRSGLVRDNTVFLYSGAGIVAGSDPSSEWEEIENKITSFVKICSENDD